MVYFAIKMIYTHSLDDTTKTQMEDFYFQIFVMHSHLYHHIMQMVWTCVKQNSFIEVFQSLITLLITPEISSWNVLESTSKLKNQLSWLSRDSLEDQNLIIILLLNTLIVSQQQICLKRVFEKYWLRTNAILLMKI